MRKVLLLSLIVLVGMPSSAWSGSHEQAASSATATAGNRIAQVAGAQTVELAASKKTAKQWAELRPDYQALRPKKR
ncbi:MAG: hypothetical protein JSV45_10185 [Chromatiales bacterium]|nr:MAG: hypothetical protein JSV45_10185 [Chromatiales bacterium]